MPPAPIAPRLASPEPRPAGRQLHRGAEPPKLWRLRDALGRVWESTSIDDLRAFLIRWRLV